MKMQGQKGKCKDDIKSYSLDRFEQVERSKTWYSMSVMTIMNRARIICGMSVNVSTIYNFPQIQAPSLVFTRHE